MVIVAGPGATEVITSVSLVVKVILDVKISSNYNDNYDRKLSRL